MKGESTKDKLEGAVKTGGKMVLAALMQQKRITHPGSMQQWKPKGVVLAGATVHIIPLTFSTIFLSKRNFTQQCREIDECISVALNFKYSFVAMIIIFCHVKFFMPTYEQRNI